MRCVCISDTHGQHEELELPKGDLLIHTGDLTKKGLPKELESFNQWLGSLPFKYKIIIAGNHDFLFEKDPRRAQEILSNAIYLEDQGIEIEGFHIWGSPVTPWFFNWAFNRRRGKEIRKHWDKIPQNIDILLTHGPPAGILDTTFRGKQVGCEALKEACARLKPKASIFGHIHEGYGIHKINSTFYINASSLDFRYRAINQPIVFTIDPLKNIHIESGPETCNKNPSKIF